MSRLGAIVVGGGHNGLICAAYLAGRLPEPVLVLERREKVGGVCATDEVFPEFRYTTAAQVLSLLRPQIIRDLNLAEHGFEFIPMATSFTPFSDGRSLLLGLGEAQDCAAIAVFSERDAAAWPRYHHTMGRLAAAIRPMLDAIPPDIGRIGAMDLLRGGMLAIAMRRLDRFERAQLVKLLTMSAAAFVEEWFESPRLRAHLAAPGTIGLWGSPRTPGTASVLMHFALGEIGGEPGTWGFVRGGMGSLADALAAAAVSRGAQIRTHAPVRRVLAEDHRVRGVELEDGTVLEADVVVSGVDPKRTFLKLLDRSELPTGFVSGIEHFRTTGNSAKVNLAVSELPSFSALPGDGAHLRGEIEIAGDDPEYMEQAFDDFRAGRWSQRPYLDIVIPSTLDDSLAPPGSHVVSIALRFVPYRLAAGPWSGAQREALGDTVVETVARYAPNLPGSILHRQVLTPADFEDIYGLTGGNILHGDMTLDQLFSMRPVAGWAGYRTPISGMYLCGSGAHPGGGVMGAPGRNAARVILRDARRRPSWYRRRLHLG